MKAGRFFPHARIVLVLLLAILGAEARTFTVMAYNVENLVDADGRAIFDDYAPTIYTRAHALTKVKNVARVIGQIDGGRGPDVVLLNEIETDLTPGPTPPDYDALMRKYSGTTIDAMLGEKFDAEIADLPAEFLLEKACADRGITGYHVIPGWVPVPGVVAPAQKCVIFSRFPVKSFRILPTPSARPVLEALLDVDGAEVYVFDNHWKSGAGDPAMERLRVKNARTLRTRLDEIRRDDPHADIIIGGDFNSQYDQNVRYAKIMTHTALNDVLGSQGDGAAVRASASGLYNLWYELPLKERGSDTYHGEWGTLIQLILSRGLFDFRGVQYVEGSFTVAKFPGLNMDASGFPIRWSSKGPAGSGFSDHFPVYARFTTTGDADVNRYLPPHAVEVAPMPVSGPAPDIALRAESLAGVPADADLRTPANLGKIFRVEGRVGEGERLTVEFHGAVYDVWSFDAQLRKRLRASHRAGDTIRFYGELGQYKGHWQFVVRDEAWVK